MRDAEVARSRAEAVQVRAVARFAALSEESRGVGAEVALTLATTEHRAQRMVAMAQASTTRLPETLAALDTGTIDSYKASKIVDATNPLSDEHAAAVDAAMVGRLDGRNPSSIRRAAVRQVVAVDPDGHAERARKRRLERSVQLVHQDDAMSTLIADLPTDTATAIYGRVDRIAKTLRGGGETRTLEQLRTDVFAELCLGHRTAETRTEVFVHVAATTLAGVDDHPAELPGHGPVPAWLARHLATNSGSVLRKVVTDPVVGTVRDVGRARYRPPAALAEWVKVRDRECRMPGCHRPSHVSDIDHTQDWARGGKTSADNLTGLCRRHHRLKDLPGWHLATDNTGALHITTPTGNVHTSRPAPLTDPRPAAPPF
ncbi:HNH endonuclease [Amycolatopsis antarctica]|uniref:HNH endonuclease n=2 Tax=Amycolatopsis antarctica TaxID=1854586 RepID=A0A263CY26_9PSEU|nr:HNH endonuclease signature motif containing protein [Amycolatopsis antarctica]OZM70236.1 HNH endonuclease [Amycolatopsis antarctica]